MKGMRRRTPVSVLAGWLTFVLTAAAVAACAVPACRAAYAGSGGNAWAAVGAAGKSTRRRYCGSATNCSVVKSVRKTTMHPQMRTAERINEHRIPRTGHRLFAVRHNIKSAALSRAFAI